MADDDGDVVIVPDALRRNQRYTVWSYVPQAKPSQLANFNGEYPAAAERYLEVVYEGVPAWNAEGRNTQMEVFFNATHEGDAKIEALESVYQAAARRHDRLSLALRGCRAPGDLVPRGGRVHLQRAAAAADRRRAAARRLHQQHEAGLLPALRRRDDADAAAPRASPRAWPSASRAGRYDDGRQGVGRQRLQRARVGRGLLPALRLDPVRPDAGPRAARRHVPAELGPVQLRRRRRHRPRRAAERPQPGAPGGLPHRAAGAGRTGQRRGQLGQRHRRRPCATEGRASSSCSSS